MRILVTGATGKIGNAVAHRLAARGDTVVALVRDPARAREVLPAAAELAKGDVTDPPSIRRAVEGADAVFNCMGIYEQWIRDEQLFERVNAEGARNVIEAARDAAARRVIHTSTFDVFHAEPGGTVSEDRVADYPKGTTYERSKQRAEKLVLAAAGDEIELVIVNPASVYGPGPWQGDGLDGAFRDVIRGRLPAAPPGGMTLVHVDDVANAQLSALERGKPGERYILADGFASIREMAAVVVDEAGRGRVPRTIPPGVAKPLARAGEAVSRLIRRPPLLSAGQLTFLLWEARADSSKARSELGVEFRPWEQGIRETARWMLDTDRA